MRNYETEAQSRVRFIQDLVVSTKVNGIIFGNSGGKDAALVGILCKMACDNTLGVSLPCAVSRNYESDLEDAILVSQQFSIAHKTISLTDIRNQLIQTVGETTVLSDDAIANIAPRLRMTTIYAIANSENRIVAGTGNRSERHTGYFTKWGDGAFDFNPIADLTATEVLEFLSFLGAPESIINKAPSAGLFEGQTDEVQMGITYASLDNFLLTGQVSKEDAPIINRMHTTSHHKRKNPVIYGDEYV